MPHSRSPSTIPTPTQPKSQPSQAPQASRSNTKQNALLSRSKTDFVPQKRTYEQRFKAAHIKAWYACEIGDLERIKKLAGKFPLMFPTSQRLYGLMCTAVKYGKTEIVKYLLTQEPYNLHMPDSKGDTPLHVSAIFDQLECAKILVAAGADPMYEAKTNPPRNAFHLACESGSRKVALYFISILDFEDQGRRSSEGVTSLDYACRSMKIPDIVEHLLFVGTRLPHKDKGICSFIPVIHEEIETLKLLARHGADFNVKNSAGETPLMLAAINGCYRAAIFLLKNRATLGYDEAVSYATKNNDTQMLHILELFGPVSSAEPLSGSPLM